MIKHIHPFDDQRVGEALAARIPGPYAGEYGDQLDETPSQDLHQGVPANDTTDDPSNDTMF
jgi:hypothetical protein